MWPTRPSGEEQRPPRCNASRKARVASRRVNRVFTAPLAHDSEYRCISRRCPRWASTDAAKALVDWHVDEGTAATGRRNHRGSRRRRGEHQAHRGAVEYAAKAFGDRGTGQIDARGRGRQVRGKEGPTTRSVGRTNKPSRKACIDTSGIAESSDLPVILYNVPSSTGATRTDPCAAGYEEHRRHQESPQNRARADSWRAGRRALF